MIQTRRFDRPVPRKRSKLVRVAIIALIVLLCGWFWYRHDLSPVSASDKTTVSVTVGEGMSASAVADTLKEKGLIRSVWAFGMFASHHGYATKLKTGTYLISPSQSTEEILEAISGGKQAQIVLTIPEGFTLKEIDALVASKGLAKPGDLIACAQTCDFSSFEFLPPKKSAQAKRGGQLEGYLYPDTYYVDAGDFVSKFFLERLLTTFRHKVVEADADEIQKSGHSLQEIVTMASLVEAETRTDEERPIVAGILWKRLSLNMQLGVDAAVRYITDKDTGALTESDLQSDSPYNLRRAHGLPPGPISNPGMSSIEAAIKPTATQYLYYLHDSNGVIHYAVTNDEHNANKAKYL